MITDINERSFGGTQCHDYTRNLGLYYFIIIKVLQYSLARSVLGFARG